MKKIIFYLTILFFAISCATAHKINTISNGMTKKEVTEKIGRPISTSSKGRVEFLNYKFSEDFEDVWVGSTTNYFIKLIDGRVESFGRLGDFDSTKDPTVNINTNSKIETKASETEENDSDLLYKELLKLKDLLDKGVLNEREYDMKKKEILERY